MYAKFTDTNALIFTRRMLLHLAVCVLHCTISISQWSCNDMKWYDVLVKIIKAVSDHDQNVFIPISYQMMFSSNRSTFKHCCVYDECNKQWSSPKYSCYSLQYFCLCFLDVPGLTPRVSLSVGRGGGGCKGPDRPLRIGKKPEYVPLCKRGNVHKSVSIGNLIQRFSYF